MLYTLDTTNSTQAQKEKRTFAAELWHTLSGAFAQSWRRYRTWRLQAQAIRQLSDLDDRMLRDIGITREDIRRAARGLLEDRPEREGSYVPQARFDPGTLQQEYKDAA